MIPEAPKLTIADVFITDELDRRAPKKIDYLQEKLALQELAARMADEPEEVLPRFVDLALEMTGGASGGLSLYEEDPAPGVFRWQYLRGLLAPFNGATTPRDFSPCGITLDRNAPVLSLHPERVYDWIADANIIVPEVLLVPLYLGGTAPLGTLWIVSDREGHFDSGHARALTELAAFVGIALRMVRTEERLHQREAQLRDENASLEARVKERTAELMASEEQLRQALKMEAVGQLTGGLAHDFNNLLTAIRGGLELMGIRLSQGRVSELNRYLTAASSSVDRAASLTHRLLAFSRRQTLSPKPTAINRLIANMEDMIRRSIGPSIQLEIVGAGGLWLAKCDPNQLENALLNLCLNARDAMPNGGTLTVETTNASLDTAVSRTRGVPRGQFAVLCVTDNGTGMPPEVVSRVFEPFYTTKPIGEGTGLGLSMVYGFARQSGGEARIYSEVGRGTTVKLYLPRHYGDEEAPQDIEQGHGSGGQTGQTVLFVDDEPAIRMLASEVLRDMGCNYFEAADAPSALKLFESMTKIDLLVFDVGLTGGFNGRQLAAAARQLQPDHKVLFITGFAENAVLGNDVLEPGMQVMTKPFSLEAFTMRVRELLALEQHSSRLPAGY
jgi:signal transduction histidine kinase/ActR/RegA family two-component response regulator